MKMLCLMPTYGRRASLLENSIQLFLDQNHPNKQLLVYDDLGTLQNTGYYHPDVFIISSPIREASIGAKYNTMMASIATLEPDAVVVWDDDDVYLPHHLSVHASVLEKHQWSKPSTITSAYFSPPRKEEAKGRFHGSIAIRVDFLQYLQEITGSMWIDTKRATFDQEMLQKLSHHSPPGDPCSIRPPSYVYRWQTSGGGHCSGGMGDPNWYDKYRPDSIEPIPSLNPHYDEDTIRILQQLPPQC